MSVSSNAKPAAGDKSPALILDQFTPYRVVALGHAISGKLARAYAGQNLTIPEWRVLAVVSQADQLAARDVVKRTPMDKMTVSRAVASLEAKEFVIRTAHDADRRVATLSLSKTGRALFDRVAALALAFEADLLAALTQKERAGFLEILARLEAHALREP